MADRKIEARRRGKGTVLAAGVVHEDGTVEAFIGGNLVTAPTVAEFEVRCGELSSTGVDVVVDV